MTTRRRGPVDIKRAHERLKTRAEILKAKEKVEAAKKYLAQQRARLKTI